MDAICNKMPVNNCTGLDKVRQFTTLKLAASEWHSVTTLKWMAFYHALNKNYKVNFHDAQ